MFIWNPRTYQEKGKIQKEAGKRPILNFLDISPNIEQPNVRPIPQFGQLKFLMQICGRAELMRIWDNSFLTDLVSCPTFSVIITTRVWNLKSAAKPLKCVAIELWKFLSTNRGHTTEVAFMHLTQQPGFESWPRYFLLRFFFTMQLSWRTVLKDQTHLVLKQGNTVGAKGLSYSTTKK